MHACTIVCIKDVCARCTTTLGGDVPPKKALKVEPGIAIYDDVSSDDRFGDFR